MTIHLLQPFKDVLGIRKANPIIKTPTRMLNEVENIINISFLSCKFVFPAVTFLPDAH
jgi:hypothetical protein